MNVDKYRSMTESQKREFLLGRKLTKEERLEVKKAEEECLKVKHEVDILSLHFAAANGALDQVKYYIEEKKIEVDALARDCTALYYAVRMCHEDVARYLLDKGADYSFAIKAYENSLEDHMKKTCGNVLNSASFTDDKCSTH